VLAGKKDVAAELLTSGADVGEEGDLGTPLHVAVFRGDLAIVTLLLDKGADIESSKKLNGDRPLHVAVSYNHPEIVALLLARGAMVEARDASDRTALHLAALKGYAAVAKVLLGADVKATFMSQKFSALHAACYSDHKEVAAVLLSFHADVNASADGWTPLHQAAEHGSPELVELLLANGANTKVKSKAGLTPLMVAKSNFDKRIAEVFSRHGVTE
jgi:ankyrin repeat protein